MKIQKIAFIHYSPSNPNLKNSSTDRPIHSSKSSKCSNFSLKLPPEVKFMSGAFLNNIGGDDNLARQIQNLTDISNQLLQKTCSTWQRFLTVMLPFVASLLFLGCLLLKSTLINFVHLIEFCQEVFLIMMMNIVRESCFYEFKLSLKTFFFVFTTRNNVPSNPNILKRIFFRVSIFWKTRQKLASSSPF